MSGSRPTNHDLLQRLDERFIALNDKLFDAREGAIPRIERKIDGHLGNHKEERRAVRNSQFAAFVAVAAAAVSGFFAWVMG